MKIKWNWGTKIFLGMTAYIILLFSLVAFIVKQDIDLVEKNYYPKGLRHQQEIDKISNALKLEKEIEITKDEGNVIIQFQSFFRPDKINGTVKIYRPSNEDFDIDLPIQPDSLGVMKVSMEDMYIGKYIVKVHYNYDGTDYYQEKSIYIE